MPGLPVSPARKPNAKKGDPNTAAHYDTLANEAERLSKQHQAAGRRTRAEVALRDAEKYRRAAKKYRK